MPPGTECRCLRDAIDAAVAPSPGVRIELGPTAEAWSIAALEAVVADAVAADVWRLVFVVPAPLPAHLGGTLDQAATVGLVSAAARNAAVLMAPAGGTANVVLHGPLDVAEACGPSCAGVDDEVRAAVESAAITQRLSTAAEVADAVAFLASDAAGYVNGIVVPVDGGLSVGRYA